jgi:hypothetical protein
VLEVTICGASKLVVHPTILCNSLICDADKAKLLEASDHLDVGLVKLTLDVSSDQGLSHGQIAGMQVEQREHVSFAVFILFVAFC